MTTKANVIAWAEAHPEFDPDLTPIPDDLAETSEADLAELLASDPSFNLLQVALAVAAAGLPSDAAVARVMKQGILQGDPSVMGEYYRALALRLDADTHLRLAEEAFATDRAAAKSMMYWLISLFRGRFPDRLDELMALADRHASA